MNQPDIHGFRLKKVSRLVCAGILAETSKTRSPDLRHSQAVDVIVDWMTSELPWSRLVLASPLGRR
jgi:hypothetical protein